MASIKKRPDGQWRARYRDEAGKEHSRHFARKIDGQQWLDRVTAAVVTGDYVDPEAGRVTFNAFFQEWSERQVWVPGTVKAMSLAVRTTTFVEMPIKAIRRSHVEAWIKAMNAAGLAPGTINTRFNNVRSVLRAAHRDKLIASNPSDGVTLPRRRRAEHAMSIPTPEQIGRLLQVAEPEFRPYIGLCAFAGLRLGEAAALQVGDVDFLRRTIHVARQVQRAGGSNVEVRAPKYGFERVVYAPSGLLTMLARHVEEREDTEPTTWLFAGSDANPPHQNTIGHRWRRTCHRAGVQNFSLHSTRHFYASGLIAAGCDVVTVQRSLGHSTASTTLNTYSHLWPLAEDRTRSAAEAMMETALTIPADSLRTQST